MKRETYLAGVEHARTAATETLNHGTVETAPDPVWYGAHAILDAIRLLDTSIANGDTPWADYEPSEED